MDSIDKQIIDILKENSRIKISDISKKVNLSIPAVSDRIKKMEDINLIEKYTVKLNREMLNQNLLVFIFITLEKCEHISSFREKIIKLNSVLECHHIAGEYDYLVKVAVESTKDLENFISLSLKSIEGIQKTNTIISLSSLKEEIN